MTKEFNYAKFKEEALKGIREGKSFNGEQNVLLPMIKDFLEGAMQAELDLHITDEHSNDDQIKPNCKNGYMSKTIKSEQGSFQLDTPRDQNSIFSPQIVEKQQTILEGAFQEKIPTTILI